MPYQSTPSALCSDQATQRAPGLPPTPINLSTTPCAVQKIRIFDTRDRAKPQLAVDAHAADVNVVSWNRLTTFMLASGSDDKSLRVWDLRALDSHVAAFSHHAKPITSIEWCPHESSMLATTSEVPPRSRRAPIHVALPPSMCNNQ